MVCWEINTISVEFKAKYKDLLERALKELGYTFRYLNEHEVLVNENRYGGFIIDLEKQKAEVNEYGVRYLNELKREYSRQALKEVSANKKWFLKKKATSKVDYEIRRY